MPPRHPLQVPCPDCQSPVGQPCRWPRSFHDGRYLDAGYRRVNCEFPGCAWGGFVELPYGRWTCRQHEKHWRPEYTTWLG